MQITVSPGQTTTISGLTGFSRALSLAAYQKKSRQTLVWGTKDLKEALSLEKEFACFYDPNDILLIPPLDVLPYYSLSPNPDLLRERIHCLGRLIDQKQSPHIIITPISQLLRKTIPRHFFGQRSFLLQVNETITPQDLANKLASLGYERVPLVEDPGTFAVRGGLIDIFSTAHLSPCRIDLFGDIIEQMRFFDPQSQKTSADTKNLQIIPAKEIILGDNHKYWQGQIKKLADERDFPKSEREMIAEQLKAGIFFHGIESFVSLIYDAPSTLLDYLPANTTLVYDDFMLLQAKHQEMLTLLSTQHKQSKSPERLMYPDEIYLPANALSEWAPYIAQINLWEQAPKADITTLTTSNFVVRQKMAAFTSEYDPLSDLTRQIKERINNQEAVFILASSKSQKNRLQDLFSKHDLVLNTLQTLDSQYNTLTTWKHYSGQAYLLDGSTSGGFYWPDEKLWVLTDEDLFGQKIKKGSVKKNAGEVFTSLNQLSPNDYVVHRDFGVGIYRELLPLTIGGIKNDFLFLQYQGGDKLYVPIDQIGKIHRYDIQEGAVPLLDKMGSGTWIKTRDKVKKATRRLAKDLLDIQAKRKLARGYAFSVSNTLFEEFEASFPYDETPDQLKAIEDVLTDMESDRPMDRLVCGDVGYGKTEVAMRAAFKAVIDHKQACVLVPTTVLSLQHFENFKKRFESHAVKIAHMSRFQTETEQKKILEQLAIGAIDIIIGTHRLLSRDVKFRDLGLLVIDEEHRFGVAQKEKIKKFKNMVDILSLSATPIPRSLNFSLVGIRDLSVINTPPHDRLSIRTFVTHFDPNTLTEAIDKELKRGGQVFFVHNRVQTIHTVHEKLLKMVPKARIKIAHGQMNEEELEEAMINFMHHQSDILLCTTIIESGLDIPNANTIIIDKADHLGLAQLYQLRGRVGRSNHRAYCYLLTPFDKAMTDTSKKRLDIIQRFTELGSGFQIAMHDLELRGAGNILGAEQSGHIAAIGYDLYVKLLEEAVMLLRSGLEEEDVECELKIPVAANIPEELVPDTGLRLTLYKQLSAATSKEACSEIRDEWIDRFGPLPATTENLILLIQIKIMATQLKLTYVGYSGEYIVLRLHPNSPIPTDYFLQKIAKSPKKFKLGQDSRILIFTGELFDKDILARTIQLLDELPH